MPSGCLKGYSSGQSHFSEINAKLAQKNEFVTQFVKKCLETRENEQNVVLNEAINFSFQDYLLDRSICINFRKVTLATGAPL